MPISTFYTVADFECLPLSSPTCTVASPPPPARPLPHPSRHPYPPTLLPGPPTSFAALIFRECLITTRNSATHDLQKKKK